MEFMANRDIAAGEQIGFVELEYLETNFRLMYLSFTPTS